MRTARSGLPSSTPEECSSPTTARPGNPQTAISRTDPATPNRVVQRRAGAFQVWFNSEKTVSMTGIAALPSTSQTIHWPNGIYCMA